MEEMKKALESALESQKQTMPELIGSEKQIKWAEDIREAAISCLDCIARNTAIAGRNLDGTIESYKELTEERKATLEEIKKMRAALAQLIGSETSAATIIDKRYKLAQDSIEKCIKNIVKIRMAAAADPENERGKKAIEMLDGDYTAAVKKLLAW